MLELHQPLESLHVVMVWILYKAHHFPPVKSKILKRHALYNIQPITGNQALCLSQKKVSHREKIRKIVHARNSS